MTDAIQISYDGYALPPDVVAQTLGIVARKGAGESYTAGVIAEGLLDLRA